ncbi:MAG: molybdopterin-dependent oxidoreductase [Nitrospinae bacterium]|nr:molybdopterin-dependent oxidoreductase [Nitrospinota bacterium]
MSQDTATEQKATVSLSINGRAVEVPRGATLLKAARMNGFKIPTLCYLDKIHSIGSCRVCSVEVEGVASPVMSCVTPVSDGMVVTTDNERIKEYRRNMIQFILVNHPLDCPVCERSGECQLQNLTYELGITKHPWETEGHKKVPVVDWGLIRYDRNLCIMCERCIDICREVQGLAALKIDGTGYYSKVNTVTGEKLDCDFCGQCWSVCPVGAISSGITFSARSWEMEKTETICYHCGVGCSFHVNTKQGKIVRITSRDTVGANRGNLCSRGRFGFEFVQSQDRLTAPLIRKGHGFETTDWDTALGYIADKLKQLAGQHGAVAGIGSERATNEDNYAFQKFFREVLGSGNIDNLANMAAPATGAGIFEAISDIPATCSFDELKQGNLFVFIGLDGSNENPVVSNHLREAIVGHGAEAALLYSKEAFFFPAPKMNLMYGYATMHHTVLALLGRVAKDVKANGSMGSDIPQSFAQTLELAAQNAETMLDAALNAQLGELAGLIRKKKDPVFIVGQEAQRHPQAAAIVQNIANLARATGGRLMVLREYCNTLGVNDMGVTPNVLPGYAKETRPELKSHKNVCDQLHSHDAKALIIADEDVLRRSADFLKFRDAMDKAEFTVVIDHFYTPTAMAADVILPSCTAAEKDGTFTNIEGRIQRVRRAVAPVGQSRPLWQIMADLAKKMGTDFGYKNAVNVSMEIATKVPLYRDMLKGGLAPYKELLADASRMKWVDPVPMKETPGAMTVLPEHSLFVMGLYTDYCPSLRTLVGKHFADFHVEGKPYVDISPKDAELLGVGEEDTLLFKTPRKEWKGRARINAQVASGSIRIPDEMDQFPKVTMVAGGKEIPCYNSRGLESGEGKC